VTDVYIVMLVERAWQHIQDMTSPPRDEKERQRLVASFKSSFMAAMTAVRNGVPPPREIILLATDIMNQREAELFYAGMDVNWDRETNKPIGRKYYRADGTFIAETFCFDKERYDEMNEAGKLNGDGLPEWLGAGRMFQTIGGSWVAIIC
jgi:hypothetical protein